jgi:excisionase family DNA binding protein
MVNEEKFLSTARLAKILGVSRITVYKKVKSGEIKATKVGRTFVIDRKDLGGILEEKLTPEQKTAIKKAVQKAVNEYGETFRLLGVT